MGRQPLGYWRDGNLADVMHLKKSYVCINWIEGENRHYTGIPTEDTAVTEKDRKIVPYELCVWKEGT